MKRFFIIFVLFLIVTGTAYFAGAFDRTPFIVVERDCSIVFTNETPNEEDGNVLLCVPAAFSSDDGKIVGHYSVGGKRKGVSDYRYTTIRLDGGYCFQQASLVRDHKPKCFSDSRNRYRRALCKKGKQYAIVHSSRPITLTSFARSLTEYDNAWNLDMGTYAYGWYRDESGLHHLGMSAYWNKDRQTNWIIVRKKIE